MQPIVNHQLEATNSKPINMMNKSNRKAEKGKQRQYQLLVAVGLTSQTLAQDEEIAPKQMVLVIKYNHIYKAQWPVDVTRFQVKSRNKSRRNGESVGGGRKQHIEIFLMQSKILMKSQNKSRRKISRFSEKCSGKGKVGDKSRFASTKVGRIYVCICVFYTAGSIGNSLFIYVFTQLWSGVIMFVFSYGLWFIFRGICIYVFAYYMVHGSSPHLQGSVGHGAQGNSIMCRC